MLFVKDLGSYIQHSIIVNIVLNLVLFISGHVSSLPIVLLLWLELRWVEFLALEHLLLFVLKLPNNLVSLFVCTQNEILQRYIGSHRIKG